MLRTFAVRFTTNPAPNPSSHAPIPPQRLHQCSPAPNHHELKIRIINAKTNQPITDEHLNVALRADQIGSVAMATDKNGIILVDTGDATTIRILSNMYADCRPRGELYTDYSIDTILNTGITTGNLCSSASPTPKPGVPHPLRNSQNLYPELSQSTGQQSTPLRREPSRNPKLTPADFYSLTLSRPLQVLCSTPSYPS